ncbi:helix-turn-helix domain-containing protein [Morganella morganii]|uniref:Helix-turn-helix transcriptional regulator n=1 Tax=Morganella morganii TaxID=582 RepID=A0A9Q4GQL0_MORMO|nr:helix-turn-helix transcriptional regulator [Morganella morganii]EKW8763176.1 helix-turn-helix transcriptional regulator [Morganella morganii]MCY0789509.1 helix-turn-helix transcriptional regulator [Morganella morganii]
MKTKSDKESVLLCRTIGFAIKERRKELGYSGTDMANLLKVSQQQYSRYERGQSQVSATMLFKIASILQYPICLFFSNYICSHVEFIEDTDKLSIK